MILDAIGIVLVFFTAFFIWGVIKQGSSREQFTPPSVIEHQRLKRFIDLQVELDLILAAALGKETEQKVVKLLNEFIERNKL